MNDLFTVEILGMRVDPLFALIFACCFLRAMWEFVCSVVFRKQRQCDDDEFTKKMEAVGPPAGRGARKNSPEEN